MSMWLYEQWKEFGPVAKEYRDQIWDRFKAATAVINKKYQAFFEDIKEQQAENLAKKSVLCEKVEEIAEREINDSNEWNACSKEIEDIQKEWKTIGFASKKDKAIRVEGERLAIHETKCGKSITTVNTISFDKEFFNGKRVVLFDDVITRGFSYARFACELEYFGAEILGGYFLGRTLNLQ